MTHQRPDWDDYFLNMANSAAGRADCTRRQIGAVLVDAFGRLRGSGYNGGRSKGPSCLAGECPRGLLSQTEIAPGSSYDTGPGSCVALHAEQNLMLYTDPGDRRGGTVYISDEPCGGCRRMLEGSGIVRIVWPNWELFYDVGSNEWIYAGR